MESLHGTRTGFGSTPIVLFAGGDISPPPLGLSQPGQKLAETPKCQSWGIGFAIEKFAE